MSWGFRFCAHPRPWRMRGRGASRKRRACGWWRGRIATMSAGGGRQRSGKLQRRSGGPGEGSKKPCAMEFIDAGLGECLLYKLASVAACIEVAVPVGRVRCVEAMEVIRWCMVSAVAGESAVITSTGIKVTIHRAMEAGGAVEPGTGAEEDAAIAPLRTVVAVGGAVVGRIVKVAIRADWRSTDVDADRDLGICFRGWHQDDGQCCCCCYEKSFHSAHWEPPFW